MNEYDHSYHFPTAGSAPPQAERAFDIATLIWALRKGWRYPFVGCLLFFAAASAYLATKPSLHKSTAQLLIDRSLSQYLTRNQIVGQPGFDIGSQVYILRSDSVLLPVVQKLKLFEDPEFVRDRSKPEERAGLSLSTVKKFVRELVGWKSEISPDLGTPRERIAVEALTKNLSIFRADVPTVINITVGSNYPTKAALIANTIADTFLATIQESKDRSAKVAARFLKERLEDLQQQLVAAEKALQAYKVTHNLTTTEDDPKTSEQLAALRTQLEEARFEQAEAKVRIEGAKRAAKKGLIGILADIQGSILGVKADNSVITQLRVQRISMSSQLRALQARVSSEHPSLKKIRTELSEIDTAIEAEGARIVSIFENRFASQKERVDEIERAIVRTVRKLESENKTRSKLRELEAAAASLLTLYDNALKQYNQLPQAGLTDDARVISRATPSPKKSSRKFWIILAGSLVAGFMLGAVVPVARELIVSPYRTASQVRRELGIPCVTVPRIRDHSSWKFWRSRNDPLEEWVLSAPQSRFADAIKNIEARILFSRDNIAPKVIGVTSCVPAEGKFTILSNLAASLASEPWGRRVLVIDCDLHKRKITEALAPDATGGLLEALHEPEELASFVVPNDSTKVDVLPNTSPELAPDAAKILGSDAMGKLLSTARETYDIVLVEVPPIMSVVDIKMIERFVEGFILVMEWGMTRQRLVNEALGEMDFLSKRLMCAALNKADASALSEIESYKGGRFTEYYVE